jgi:hypothetical protein
LFLTGSPAKAGLVGFCKTVPILLFLPAGALADRMDRRRLMVVCDGDVWERSVDLRSSLRSDRDGLS